MLIFVTLSLHLELEYVMGSTLYVLKIRLPKCVESSKNVASRAHLSGSP